MQSKLIQQLADHLSDLETRFFLPFLLLCRYRFKNFSQKGITGYQQRRIKRMVRWVMARSAFYPKHYSGYDPNDFGSLPTTNKKLLMDHLSGFNTLGLGKDEIIEFCFRAEKSRDFSKRLKGVNVGMSSGTSGNKGVEIASRSEENFLKAAFLARFDFPRKQKINLAFILRVSSPAFSLNRFGHRLTYINQLDSIENISTHLGKLQPNILSAPPSMLKVIAREIERGRLAIRPQRIISYAEVLYPDVKLYLRKIYQCPVHEIYKCSEGAIAITCKYEKLHINEDLVAVELLNEDGSSTTPGQPCRQLLITDLHKKSLPVIRYALNDIITISSENCRCGSNFRIIENIQGRADDMFWGLRKTDQALHFIFPDFISRMIISVSDNIEEYQAIQKSLTEVELRILLRSTGRQDAIARELTEGVRKVFSQYNCTEPDVKVIFAEPFINIHSRKLRRIICEIENE